MIGSLLLQSFLSGRTIEALRADGALAPEGFRIIWSSPGYSHCCFTAHGDMDPALVEKITQTFVAIDAQDPAGKAVLEGEGCECLRARGYHRLGDPRKSGGTSQDSLTEIVLAQSA